MHARRRGLFFVYDKISAPVCYKGTFKKEGTLPQSHVNRAL